MRALSIAATGMLAQQLNVEVISNNLANLSTTGFKRLRAEFQDLLYQTVERAGVQSSDTGTLVPSGIQIGVGVKAGGTYRINEQGDLNSTGNAFDLAIQGKGFFRVTLPSGEDAYTRAGAFQVNENGELVTPDGFPIGPGLTIPREAIDINVNDEGEIEVTLDDQVQTQNIGQLELASFFNEAGLESIGNNLLRETAASGQPTISVPGAPGFGTILQGFLETSNVNPVTEISALITAQRAYEMNSKVITTADEMMSVASNLRR